MLRPGRAGTTDVEVDRLVDAERLATQLAATDTSITVTDIRRLHAAVVGAAEVEPWRRDVVWLGDDRGPDPRMRIQPAAPERWWMPGSPTADSTNGWPGTVVRCSSHLTWTAVATP